MAGTIATWLRLRPLAALALAAWTVTAAAQDTAPAAAPAAALTPFGAESAGNKEGIIPTYSGGLVQAPPAYRIGSVIRPDPFHAEKPLFSINAHNQAQFEAMLTDGARQLLDRNPAFRIDVYATHRTAVYPPAVIRATQRNAQGCKTTAGGMDLVASADCHGGLPFPAPQDGYQAMWNHLLAWRGIAVAGSQRDWLVDRAGRGLLEATTRYLGMPWYAPGYKPGMPYRQMQETVQAPAQRAGERWLVLDYLDPSRHPRQTWEYVLGERSARIAPGGSDDRFAGTGDLRAYDDEGLFAGALDRFDFRLVGKREMIIPYNDYKQVYRCKPEDDLEPHFVNPDCLRWELHRVWVVDASLKHGLHHAYTHRVFYWDEDTWSAGASDEYDDAGNLYRAGFVFPTVWYESQINSASQYVIYDFKKNAYALYGEAIRADGPRAVEPWPAMRLTPEMMAGTSVR